MDLSKKRVTDAIKILNALNTLCMDKYMSYKIDSDTNFQNNEDNRLSWIQTHDRLDGKQTT